MFPRRYGFNRKITKIKTKLNFGVLMVTTICPKKRPILKLYTCFDQKQVETLNFG